MTNSGDTGATLHAEFNKGAKKYETNYTNPVTSGQIQDALREEDAKSQSTTSPE